MIWNPTIPTSSLFHCGHLLSLYLLLWLFSGLMHTIRENYSEANEPLERRALGRIITAGSRCGPGHEQFSWFSWWVRRSQFLAFLCWERSLIQVGILHSGRRHPRCRWTRGPVLTNPRLSCMCSCPWIKVVVTSKDTQFSLLLFSR